MAAGRRPVRELAAAQPPRVGGPAAMTTQQADAPTDHGWVDNHQGLLSCIAGDVRTVTTVVACPYYLRHDVAAELPPTARPRWNPNASPSLTYHGDPYYKITQVAWPHEWRPLVAALPARHAAVPAAWSLFTLLERRPELTVIDPRRALTDRLDNAPETSRSARLIRELLSGLGDTHNRENLLGLTGSAALSPTKLDTGTDLDLLVYPPANTGSLDPLLTALGAQFLNELPETDSRLRDYQRSRIMPPLADHATGLQLRHRRRDVCWIDGLRLDITARFAADYRTLGSWDVGDAHTMPDPLLAEGAIHHLDMIRYLSGQDIATVTAITTNPPGSSFAGDSVAGLLLRLADHGFALYEATLLAAGTENRWRQEHYRAECEHGSLDINGPTLTITQARHTEHRRWPAPDMLDGHRTLVPTFADWVTGQGPAPDTTLDDNLRTLSTMLAALESSRQGTTAAVSNLELTPTPPRQTSQRTAR